MNNSPLELQEYIKLPDNSIDDPNKDHYSLRENEKEKMLSDTFRYFYPRLF